MVLSAGLIAFANGHGEQFMWCQLPDCPKVAIPEDERTILCFEHWIGLLDCQNKKILDYLVLSLGEQKTAYRHEVVCLRSSSGKDNVHIRQVRDDELRPWCFLPSSGGTS